MKKSLKSDPKCFWKVIKIDLWTLGTKVTIYRMFKRSSEETETEDLPSSEFSIDPVSAPVNVSELVFLLMNG